MDAGMITLRQNADRRRDRRVTWREEKNEGMRDVERAKVMESLKPEEKQSH